MENPKQIINPLQKSKGEKKFLKRAKKAWKKSVPKGYKPKTIAKA